MSNDNNNNFEKMLKSYILYHDEAEITSYLEEVNELQNELKELDVELYVLENELEELTKEVGN